MCIQGGPEKVSAWSILALQTEGNIQIKCMWRDVNNHTAKQAL